VKELPAAPVLAEPQITTLREDGETDGGQARESTPSPQTDSKIDSRGGRQLLLVAEDTLTPGECERLIAIYQRYVHLAPRTGYPAALDYYTLLQAQPELAAWLFGIALRYRDRIVHEYNAPTASGRETTASGNRTTRRSAITPGSSI
jgi:hypothetical protein